MGEYNEVEFFKVRDRLHEVDKRVAVLEQAKRDAELALELAKKGLEHVQAAQNEWRQENIDQRALYLPKGEMQGLIANEGSERRALEQRIRLLESVDKKSEGQHSAFDTLWVRTISVITLLAMALGFIYKVVTGK